MLNSLSCRIRVRVGLNPGSTIYELCDLGPRVTSFGFCSRDLVTAQVPPRRS